MKTTIQLWVFWAVSAILTLPSVAQDQFNYVTNNGTITITKYTGSGGQVTIPSTIKGLPVTSIGYQAFKGCTSLTNIIIPASVTSIGHEAFADCPRLTSITIPASVTNIGNSAFICCPSLTSVSIPHSVNRIKSGTFSYCSGLTSVTFGSGVAIIGERPFWECTKLIGIYFKGNAPSIEGSGVLKGNDKMTVYYLPSTTGWGKTFGGRPTAVWNLQTETNATAGVMAK